MAYTQLSLNGLPGKRYSFSAKDPAPIVSGPHTGLFTELSVIGLPGQRHSFTAKTPAGVITGPHTGLFTELSVIGLPGQRHSFTAKTPAGVITGPHTGLFTELSVMALPGMRHAFAAKSPVYVPPEIPIVPPPALVGGGFYVSPYTWQDRHKDVDKIRRNDDEFMMLLEALLPIILN